MMLLNVLCAAECLSLAEFLSDTVKDSFNCCTYRATQHVIV